MDWYWCVGNQWIGIGVWVISGLVLACEYEWTGIRVWVMRGLVLVCG